MSKKLDTWKDNRCNVYVRRENGTIEVKLSFEDDPGLTEQSHAKDCDLHYIIEQYVRSELPIALQEGEFRDMNLQVDYQTAFNAVQSMNKLFMKFPADVRNAFNHSPAAFAAALHDPGQRDRLIELGILEPSKKAPKPQSGGASKEGGSQDGNPPSADQKTPD